MWLQLLGLVVLLSALVLFGALVVRLLYPAIRDGDWRADRDLVKPSLGRVFSSAVGVLARIPQLGLVLLGMMSLFLLLAAFSVAAKGFSRNGASTFTQEVDGTFTETLFPLYRDVIFPLANTTAALGTVAIPVSNWIGGTIRLINRESLTTVFGCTQANFPGFLLEIANTLATFMRSILDFLANFVLLDAQLLRVEPWIVTLQAAYKELHAVSTGIPYCMCEVLHPIWRTVYGIVTSSNLGVFLEGWFNTGGGAFLRINPMGIVVRSLLSTSIWADAFMTLLDLITRIIALAVDLIANPQDWIDAFRDNLFNDLTRQPKFNNTAEAYERIFVGAFGFVDDVIEGAIKGFYPPRESGSVPRTFKPIGHYLAAFTHSTRLFWDSVFHIDQVLMGKYWGHIQAGIDPISEHVQEAAAIWYDSSNISRTSFFAATYCVFAGESEFILGVGEAMVRAIVGLPFSGREAPQDFAVRYTFDNNTSYRDFLMGDTVRDPLKRADAGFAQAGYCMADFIYPLNSWTGLAWNETFHLIHAIVLPFRELFDNLPLFDGDDGYLSGGKCRPFTYSDGTDSETNSNETFTKLATETRSLAGGGGECELLVQDFKDAVQNAFNESKFMARSWGNVWSQLMSAADETYSQTELFVEETTASVTAILVTNVTDGETITGTAQVSGTITDDTRTGVSDEYGLWTVTRTDNYTITLTIVNPTATLFPKEVTTYGPTRYTELGFRETTLTFVPTVTEVNTLTEGQTVLLRTESTTLGTAEIGTTGTDTRVGIYYTCPSLTLPHAVYYNDTIFDSYPEQGVPYGWCCFGRFVERFMRVILAVLEVATDTAIHVAAKEGAGDTALRSVGTAFCPGGPGDLNREFVPLLRVMFDDLGCTVLGIVRHIIDEQGSGASELALTCPGPTQDYMFSKVVRVTYGLQTFVIEFVVRLVVWIFQLISTMISTFANIPSVEGGCKLLEASVSNFDACDGHLVDPMNMQGLCDLISDFYDFTAGAFVEFLLDIVDLLVCAFGNLGFTGETLESFLLYFAPAGPFQGLICKAINFLGRVTSLIRMVFNRQIIDLPLIGQASNQKGVVNYLWCKVLGWLPFLANVADALETVQGVIDAAKCIINEGLSFFDNFGSCIVSSFAPGTVSCCGCSAGDFFCACTLPNFGSCLSSLKKKRDGENETAKDVFVAHSPCTKYFNHTNTTDEAINILMTDSYKSCIASDLVTMQLDALLMNTDYPEVRLVPPKTFFSFYYFSGVAMRLMAMVPTLIGDVTQFSLSDSDPFNFTVANCSQAFNGTDEKLEQRICEIAVGYMRALREYSAQGNETIVGSLINIFGDILHLYDHKADGSLTLTKRAGGSAWSQHLDELDARAHVHKVKRYAPPPSTTKKTYQRFTGKKAPMQEAASWLKEQYVEGAGVGDRKDSGLSAVKHHIDERVLAKKVELGMPLPRSSKRAFEAPNISLPANWLCRSIAEDTVVELGCETRNPCWSPLGQEIGTCERFITHAFAIPTCGCNSTIVTDFACCTTGGVCNTTLNGTNALDLTTYCPPNFRLYGGCDTTTEALCAAAPVTPALWGACCDGSTCVLQPNSTACGASNSFAGVGTTCSDSDLPVMCGACNGQNCRRCDFVTGIIDGFLQHSVNTGVDYFNLFDGAATGFFPRPEFEFADDVLPEPDEDFEEGTEDVVVGGLLSNFEVVYNWIVGVIDAWFDLSIPLMDSQRLQARIDKFVSTTGELSLVDWLHNLYPCNVLEHGSCARGDKGVGLVRAIVFVTSLGTVVLYLLRRFSPVPVDLFGQPLIILVWLALIYLFAFAASPLCLFPASLFYVTPIIWPVPYIPDCSLINAMDDLLSPLKVDCFDRCDYACPNTTECFPCVWVPDGESWDCNASLKTGGCCNDRCRCPGAETDFKRVFPPCHQYPFNFTTASREALYFFRRRTPSTFVFMKSARMGLITTDEEWEFSSRVPGAPGDSEWTTREEAVQFAIDDPRWDRCYRQNRLFWSTWIWLLMILMQALGVVIFAFFLYAALIAFVIYYTSRVISWVGNLFASRQQDWKKMWRKKFQVVAAIRRWNKIARKRA